MNDVTMLDMIDREDIKLMGKRLARLRGDMGLTQTELARLVNESVFAPKVSQSQIANIENGGGRHWPSARLLGGLAQVLQTSSDYILGLTDDQSAYSEEKDQVVVSIEDPNRRAKIQAIADALRLMPSQDVELISNLVDRIKTGQPKMASREDYEELDRLWTLVFMMAGAEEAQRLLDTGLPASRQFKRMVALTVAKDNEVADK